MSPVSRSDQADMNAPSSTSANSAAVVRHGTLVTIATYNEIENLPRLVDEIFSYVPDVDVLVIDDDSPDGFPITVSSSEWEARAWFGNDSRPKIRNRKGL